MNDINDYICTDADEVCKAKAPSSCWKHGMQYNIKNSAIGKNKFHTGFNKHNLEIHYKKHNRQYPGITKQAYDETALELMQQACGGNIRGYVRENGQIVRYNRTTNDMVIGNNNENNDVDVGIATMYKIKERDFDRFLKEEAYGDDYY